MLIPDVKFNIVMIGTELSKKCDGKVTENGRVTVTTRSGKYSKVSLSKPNIAIGKSSKKSSNTLEGFCWVGVLRRASC